MGWTSLMRELLELEWLRRIVVAMLLLPFGAAHAAERLYMWEVKGPGGTAYLYGSVHLCRADCFPLPAAVVSAADTSQAFALELDPERPGLQEQLLKRALCIRPTSRCAVT